MMNLALMNRFFQSVDSEGRSPIAEQILSRWSIPGPVSHHRASENFAWSVGEPQRPSHFLRFNHETERAVPRLEGEIAFIRHLASSGLPVTTPVASRDGQYVETVDSELGLFHASVFTALHGSEPDAEELDLHALELWGELVAKVHSASEGFRERYRPHWSDVLGDVRELIPRVNQVAHRELDDVEQRLSTYAIEDSLFGLIHYDIDNCVWNGGVIEGIMDFDDCLYCWFVADIVSALAGLFDKRIDHIDLGDVRLDSFVRGYRSMRPITDDDVCKFPVFLRFGQLVTYGRTIWSLGSGAECEEFDWATELRRGCEIRIAQANEEFAEHPLSDFA